MDSGGATSPQDDQRGLKSRHERRGVDLRSTIYPMHRGVDPVLRGEAKLLSISAKTARRMLWLGSAAMT
eukprot:3473986-Karenia_brevis.AAC.1